ncbi:MAG: autotransporter assembly complex family protein [Geminicoccaceae bacterium]
MLWLITPALGQIPGFGQQTEGVPFEVMIEGELEDDLRARLEDVAGTVRGNRRPPRSLRVLRRRAESDMDTLDRALRAEGYYRGEVELRVEPPPEEGEPAQVLFQVTPGPRYRLNQLAVRPDPPEPTYQAPSLESLGLVEGEPALTDTILSAEQQLLDQALAAGHALAETGQLEAVVDHRTRAMDVTLVIAPGPKAALAMPAFTGTDGVDDDYLADLVPWEPGDTYTPDLIQEFRTRLIDTQLFSTVRITPGQELDDDGLLAISVDATQRRHRTIGAGVRFRSDEGPGGTIFWEHRNLREGGERLRAEIDASGIGFELGGQFRKPQFLRADQDLLANAQFEIADTDAFESTSIGAGVAVERQLQPGMTASLGVAYRATEITQDGDTDTFGLLSLPARFAWDTSDNLLDPTDGFRLQVEGEPFVDTLGEGLTFGKIFTDYRHYTQISEAPWLVLATRFGVGSIFGEALEDIPADELFFAGGGGSVRGIEFQFASPLDEDDDPIGGRSILLGAVELRTRVTETIGFAAFVDAGSAFEESIPDFNEDIRVGAGLGFRYITPVGPLRVDVGVPVDRRSTDEAFQIYISLGQAF